MQLQKLPKNGIDLLKNKISNSLNIIYETTN